MPELGWAQNCLTKSCFLDCCSRTVNLSHFCTFSKYIVHNQTVCLLLCCLTDELLKGAGGLWQILLKQFCVLPQWGENYGQQGTVSRKSTDLVPVSHDSAFHLWEERQTFYMVRHATLIFGFSWFLLLLSLLNTHHGLWLTCLFLFMCTVTLDKGYFSNIANGAESS